MRTQVVVVGGGPSGLLLSQILNRAGIETVLLEKRTRDHVLSRIRAGVLERGTVEKLHEVGIGDRLTKEGFVHDGCCMAAENRQFRIDFKALVDRAVTVYGQTEVTRDLYDAQDRLGARHIHSVEGVVIEDADRDAPSVTYQKQGTGYRVACDFVAGCDGFWGVSRATVPRSVLTEYERVYPFGWLGVLSETPPVNEELIYAAHPDGFALASMRNPNLSRYYIQVAATDTPENWSDDAFWDALRRRLPDESAEALVTGPSVEKSVTPLRSYVAEPMRWGRLFLCGDAAHIVPPTGAKGLNLAVSDVHYLSEALLRYYQDADTDGIETYSQRALARVWKAVRFSWWMTTIMHRFPDQTGFDRRIQQAEIDYLRQSTAARLQMAENYVGLPF